MSIQLKVIDPGTDQRWDEFVWHHPLGSICHHSAWGKVIESTYGYRPFYVALEDSGTDRLEGIIPFFLVNSRWTGKRLISLPFTSYCDPLIPAEKFDDVVEFALNHFPDIDFLELRALGDNNQCTSNRFARQSAFATDILDLHPDLDDLFKSFHSTSVRQRIKRAEKNGLSLRMGEGEQDLKIFYRLETAVRKKHGLPPQPFSFFENMWKVLKPKNLLMVPLIEHDGRVIAAATIIKFKHVFYFEYSASDQNYLRLCPNHKLIWETIKIARAQGAGHFDFGRSSLSNRSLIEFKERWGAKRYHLTYYFFPKAKRINMQGGPGRRLLETANHYLPHSLLQLEGRLIYRHLG